jgi:hypothetical protein
MDFHDMVSEDDLRKAIRNSAEVNAGLDKLAQEVKAYWQEIAPKDSGQYAASTRVRKVKDKDGTPMRRITNTHPAAHIIEYGSNDTPKFAVRARVAGHFGNEPE